MDSLGHLDSFYLRAAQGWFELGNCTEAAAELARLSGLAREHPDALGLNWQIAVKLKRWEDGLLVAERLCTLAPGSAFGWIHRSYCLHELKRTQEAWDLLLEKWKSFPEEWLISYNLACYACQLGKLREARRWLIKAAAQGDPADVNRLAAEDADLKGLLRTEG
jgi:predicted Zn-dependent protease